MFELYNACYYLEIRNFITKQKQNPYSTQKTGIIKKNCEL